MISSPRSRAYGIVQSTALSAEPSWYACDLVPGVTYRLRSLVEGRANTADNAALIRFDMGQGRSEAGRGLSISAAVGAYSYLRSGPGIHRTDRFFSVDAAVRRFGVMSWANRGPVELKSLTVEPVVTDLPTTFFLSFDVEALPIRAPRDHIDTLVWGKIDGGEYGIRRICDILEQHGLIGNFLVDFASCGSEGDQAQRRIVDFLAERGHEVHMHLHSERLAEQWGLRATSGKSVFLDATAYDISCRMLEFTMTKYERFVGRPARLFRSGGYKTNPDLVLAAGALGIEALSNYRDGLTGNREAPGDGPIGRGPFVWDNGVLEIPVDASSPEASTYENFVNKYTAAVWRKYDERTFNMVMHSWSLTQRTPDGYQSSFSPEHEQRFHRLCEHARNHGSSYGYSQYLDKYRVVRPKVRIGDVWSAPPDYAVIVASGGATMVTCNMCRAVLGSVKLLGDKCPSCGSGPNSRRLRFVMEDSGETLADRSVAGLRLSETERREFLSASQVVADLDEWPGVGALRGAVGARQIVDASVDRFVALDLLSDADDLDTAVAEIARVLRPGGILITSAPKATANGSRSGAGLDPVELLSKHLSVTAIPAWDPATLTVAQLYFAQKAAHR